jgi:hypothetical protein
MGWTLFGEIVLPDAFHGTITVQAGDLGIYLDETLNLLAKIARNVAV